MERHTRARPCSQYPFHHNIHGAELILGLHLFSPPPVLFFPLPLPLAYTSSPSWWYQSVCLSVCLSLSILLPILFLTSASYVLLIFSLQRNLPHALQLHREKKVSNYMRTKNKHSSLWTTYQCHIDFQTCHLCPAIVSLRVVLCLANCIFSLFLFLSKL